MRRGTVLATLAGSWMLAMALAAFQEQPRPRPKRPEIRNLKENLYIIGGSQPEDPATFTGGNTLALVTQTGVVVVDTKNPGFGRTILDLVKTVTDKPITMVLNSHGHSDHAGSNVEMGATVEFVTHENIRAMWAKTTCNNVGNCDKFKGDNAKYLPKRTFKDKLSLSSGKDRIELYHFGRAHTNGDTWIVFPSLRVMHVGDLYRPKVPPFIDVDNGGSGVEFPETLARGVAAISGVEQVVPGHGPVMTWEDLKMHRDFMRDFVSYVEKGKKAGRTAEELGQAYKVPARFSGYLEGLQNDRARVGADIKIIYSELR